jgi:hypothetical protein
MEMMFVLVFFGVYVLMYLIDFNEAKKINQKILEPAINELSELFEDLEVSCTYGGQRNRTVIGYEFRYRKHASERKAG